MCCSHSDKIPSLHLPGGHISFSPLVSKHLLSNHTCKASRGSGVLCLEGHKFPTCVTSRSSWVSRPLPQLISQPSAVKTPWLITLSYEAFSAWKWNLTPVSYWRVYLGGSKIGLALGRGSGLSAWIFWTCHNSGIPHSDGFQSESR